MLRARSTCRLVSAWWKAAIACPRPRPGHLDCACSADRPGQDKIHEDFRELLESILGYLKPRFRDAPAGSDPRGAAGIKEQYGRCRRTEISEFALNIHREDLIAPRK